MVNGGMPKTRDKLTVIGTGLLEVTAGRTGRGRRPREAARNRDRGQRDENTRAHDDERLATAGRIVGEKVT